MKKLIVLVVALAGLLLSCEGNEYQILNNSSHTVTFYYSTANFHQGAKTPPPETLNPGQSTISSSRTVELKKYDASPMTISYNVIDRYNGEFVDNPPIPLEILNNSGKPAKLTAAGCMDVEFIELLDDTPNTSYNIFTSKPEFTALLSSGNGDTDYRFPATVNYTIGEKVIVTIN
jgi:hypothetical protein